MQSLIIPAYNEGETLCRTVAEAALLSETEIIVSDDGSTDGTAERMLDYPVRLVRSEENRGKGHAVALGAAAAKGEYLFYTDADLSYPLSAIAEARRLLEEGADIVCGRRIGDYPPLRRAASIGYRILADTLLGSTVTDIQCGFKGMRKAAAQRIFPLLQTSGFAFDAELLYLARQQGMMVAELPVRMTHSHASKVSLLQDGVTMALDLWRIRRRWRKQEVYEGR